MGHKQCRGMKKRHASYGLFSFYYKKNSILAPFSNKSPTQSLTWSGPVWLGSGLVDRCRALLKIADISFFPSQDGRSRCRSGSHRSSLGLVKAGHHCLVQCFLVGLSGGDPIGAASGTQTGAPHPCLGLCEKGRLSGHQAYCCQIAYGHPWGG